MLSNPSSPPTSPGLPGGSPPSSGGSGQGLNGDGNYGWANTLQPISLGIVGAAYQVSFPAEVMKEEQSNALAIHTYPNLDGGKVENMGRNPAKFHVKAILTNSIFPGAYENWVPGILFPVTFEALVNVLLNTTSDKTFSHPVYGQTNVQVERWDYEINAKGPRDGAIVNMLLIETISASDPSYNTITITGINVTQAANALDNNIAAAPSTVNPPGMSLSSFFGAVTGLIQNVVSFPQNTVAALAQDISPIVYGGYGIVNTLAGAVPNAYNSILTSYQETKNSVLNTTQLQTEVQAANNIFNGTSNPTASNPNPPLTPTPAPRYDQSTVYATQSIFALNNTTSQNGFQFIDKIMTAVVALRQHYINQNNNVVAQIIESCNSYLFQLQQVQSALVQNTNNQAVKVYTYVFPTNQTWFSAARFLNNTVDQLIGLNQGLIYDFWVPAFTTINYYQAV